MINQHLLHEKQSRSDISLLVASRVLRNSLTRIQKACCDLEINFSFFSDKQEGGKYIQIWLGPVWLYCYFNEDESCECSLLVFNSMDDIPPYIESCKESFSYDYLNGEWINEDEKCRISMQNDEEGYYLYILAS